MIRYIASHVECE